MSFSWTPDPSKDFSVMHDHTVSANHPHAQPGDYRGPLGFEWLVWMYIPL